MTPTWYERRILLGCMTLAAAVTSTLLLADFAQEPDQDLTLNMAAAAPAPAHQQAVNQPALVSDAPESAISNASSCHSSRFNAAAWGRGR